MLPKTALGKLRRLLGRKAYYNLNPKAPLEAEKAEHRNALWEIRAERKELIAAREARAKELLDADPRIQELRAQIAELNAKEKRTPSPDSYRITAGTIEETIPGFPIGMVAAQADTWAEIFAILERKTNAAAQAP